MNYLIITTKYGDEGYEWLTNELASSLSKSDNVVVFTLSWNEDERETECYTQNGIEIIRYKLPKFFYKKNIGIKFVKQLVFSIFAYNKYKKILKNKKIDNIIGFSPSYLTYFLLRKLKNKKKIKSYMILWDFFPYYLKDLKILRNNFLLKILTFYENISIKNFNYIGVMTKKNKEFLLKNYKNIKEKNIDILPIWTQIRKVEKNIKIREKYGFNRNDIILVYGGAHTIVQELDNILELSKKLSIYKKVKLVMIGKGNDKERIIKKANEEKIENLIFLDFIPRNEYEELIASFNIGIVSLSRSLSVPSFPSKSLDYLKCQLPIIASIDSFTDYGEILEKEMKAGFFSIAGDSEGFYKNALKLIENEDLCNRLGMNGYQYYIKNFSVENIVKIIKNRME